MVKRVKKILALAMMWALLGASISGAGADSYVYAAEEGKTLNAAKDQASSAIDTKNLYQTEKSFTVGTSLGADEFDGLKVTYDGKKAYSVKKGEQTVILSVTVLDETRAKTGIEQLTLKYGKVKILNKKSATTVFACRITGVEPGNTASPGEPEQQQSSDSGSAEESGSGSDTEVIRGCWPVPECRPEDKNTKTTRTVILYIMGADIESDEAFVTRQLLDLLESDIPESMRFIVVTGGSELWHMDDLESYKQYVTETLFPDRASYDECTDKEKARIDADAKKLFEKYSTEISGVQIWEIESGGNSLKLLRTVDNEFVINPDFIT